MLLLLDISITARPRCGWGDDYDGDGVDHVGDVVVDDDRKVLHMSASA